MCFTVVPLKLVPTFATITVLAMTLLLHSQAQARSYIPRLDTVADLYKILNKSGETFIVVHGQLTSDESGLRETDKQNQGKTTDTTSITARVQGKLLSRRGFDTPFNLQINCSDRHCNRFKVGIFYLFFLKKTKDDFQLYDEYVIHSTPERLDSVAQCFRGDSCPPFGIIVEGGNLSGDVIRLPESVIRRVAMSRARAYQNCYKRQLKVKPDLNGKIEILVKISGKGTVISSKVSNSSMNSPKVENCIRENMNKLRFPAPQDGKRLTFRYPFYFKSK